MSGTPPLWPWQERGLAEILRLLGCGNLSICVASPTGMGKGLLISSLATHFASRGGRTILFTNRRMLTRQTGERFEQAGISFGYAAAGYDHGLHEQVLVASAQTVNSRVERGRWELPPADLVLIDECHLKAFDGLLEAYRAKYPGVATVGFTATPVGLKGKYEKLVIAGTKAEGRKHGALVRCDVFAPTEPDLKGVRFETASEKTLRKIAMQCVVFGDIFEHWKRLNPDGGQTLLWAPGVPESRWFVEEFRQMGVNAEHIDGDTSEEERARIAAGSKDGSIQVVSSYGVLREGVDWPWVRHGILVQVCGGISTYLQIVGRILRTAPGKDGAILQDHSGAFHRHGSPNLDRNWELRDTDKSIAKERKKRIQQGKESEAICCPRCHGVRATGPKCPHCGYEHTRSVRMVRTEAGELKRMVGSVVKRKRQVSEGQKAWSGCLYAAARSGRTMRQAAGDYKRRTGQDVPGDVFPQPQAGSPDWERRVCEVYPKLAGKKKESVA